MHCVESLVGPKMNTPLQFVVANKSADFVKVIAQSIQCRIAYNERVNVLGKVSQRSHEYILALFTVNAPHQCNHKCFLAQSQFQTGDALLLKGVGKGGKPFVIQAQRDDVHTVDRHGRDCHTPVF